MTIKEFKSFKRKAVKFKIEDRLLFRRLSKNVPLRKVVDNKEYQKEVVRQIYNENRHRRKEGTYTKVLARYQWPGLYKTVKKYTGEYPKCQEYLYKREEEALYLTQIATLQERVLIDIIYILTAKLGKQYLESTFQAGQRREFQ